MQQLPCTSGTAWSPEIASCWLLIPSPRGRCLLLRSRSDDEHAASQVPPLNLDGTLELHVPEIAAAARTVQTTAFRICISAQMSAIVSRRSSAIAAIDGCGERSERVSPASVNVLHSVASAGTTGSREGQGVARAFRSVDSRCVVLQILVRALPRRRWSPVRTGSPKL